MKYLVKGTGGPGFAASEEVVRVLGNIILPSFDKLIQLEEEKKILGGGLPVGDRAFIFVMEASSNEEVDSTLRNIPMWGSLDWEVIPLQSFAGRASIERKALEELRETSL
jgi:hypothetical protein